MKSTNFRYFLVLFWFIMLSLFLVTCSKEQRPISVTEPQTLSEESNLVQDEVTSESQFTGVSPATSIGELPQSTSKVPSSPTATSTPLPTPTPPPPEILGYPVEILVSSIFLQPPNELYERDGFQETLKVYTVGGGGGSSGSCGEGLNISLDENYFVVCHYGIDLEDLRVELTKPDGTIKDQFFIVDSSKQLFTMFCVEYIDLLLLGTYKLSVFSEDTQETSNYEFEVNDPEEPTLTFGTSCSDLDKMTFLREKPNQILTEKQTISLLFKGFVPESHYDVVLFSLYDLESHAVSSINYATDSYFENQSYSYIVVNTWSASPDVNGRLAQVIPSPIFPGDGKYILAVLPKETDDNLSLYEQALVQLPFLAFKSLPFVQSAPFELDILPIEPVIPPDLPDNLEDIYQVSPQIPPCSDNQYVLKNLQLFVCNENEHNNIDLILTYPNGNVFHLDTLSAKTKSYCLDAAHFYLPGSYRLQLKNGNNLETLLIDIPVETDIPVISLSGGGEWKSELFGPPCAKMNNFRPTTLYLAGFQPNEIVKIYDYTLRFNGQYEFVEQWSVQTDKNGKFMQHFSTPFAHVGFLIAIGEVSVRTMDILPGMTLTASAAQLILSENISETSSQLSEIFPNMSPLIYIQAGEYLMGADLAQDPLAEEVELPRHIVNISDFWIEETEVSNSQYDECVDIGFCSVPVSDSSEGSSFPVVNVTYSQAQEYCEWAGGRLPTEAEWEKAARFGRDVIYPWGNNPLDTSLPYANYGNLYDQPWDVLGGRFPNHLFNMAGNVWEWVSDWFGETYYSISPETNPNGPEAGSERVVRGGSWSSGPEFLRTTNRFSRDPDKGYNNVGFRCITIVDPYP